MEWVNQLIGIAALALGGWIARKINTPSDRDRATLLATIAEAAAALVVSLNPRGDWDTLVQEVVKRIVDAAGLPTRNRAAIERAAAAALLKLAPSKLGT